MGKPVPETIKKLEAIALERLIRERYQGKDAAFAREAGITGGRAMLHQHLTYLKPISLEAGKKYAKALNCRLSDFSERLATLIEPVPNKSADLPANVALLLHEPSPRELLILDIARLANLISDTGLHVLKDKAIDLAKDYPSQKANSAEYTAFPQ